MFERVTKKPWLMMGMGWTMGVLGSMAMLLTTHLLVPAAAPQKFAFPETMLNATATHGGSTMAIATGPIDDGVEGLIVLDFITGELQASVLNPRTGAMGGLFKHNVVADLGVEQGKQPKYLLATGRASIRASGGNVRPAESVIYVADENTGRYVAYMLPWNRAAAQYNFAQVSPMVKIGQGTARNIELE